MVNQEKLKPTCQQCYFTKHQQVPATHLWNKGFSETWQWLCQPCYRAEQIKWIIWEEQKNQALDKYLVESEENTREFLRKNQ